MGQIYALPYQVLEPELAFVVDGAEGVAGYLFGALDTSILQCAPGRPTGIRRCSGALPTRAPTGRRWRGSDWARHAIHHPDFDIPDALAAYPSHGHIDLLPQARGRGIGRRCMGFLERQLAAAGSTGLFLDVDPRNTEAQRFYAALGYEHVAIATNPESSTFMAKIMAV